MGILECVEVSVTQIVRNPEAGCPAMNWRGGLRATLSRCADVTTAGGNNQGNSSSPKNRIQAGAQQTSYKTSYKEEETGMLYNN